MKKKLVLIMAVLMIGVLFLACSLNSIQAPEPENSHTSRTQFIDDVFFDIVGNPNSQPQFGTGLVMGDFNNSGVDEVVIGVNNGIIPGAGGVYVVLNYYPGIFRVSYWDQNSPGIIGVSEADDLFGSSLAVGDFDGDGNEDLAIGASGEAVGTKEYSGAVNVLYGSDHGLSSARNQLWTQNSPGILDSCESNERFGESLAVGDFNGDGYDDLAIGAPGEEIDEIFRAGMVHIIYGSDTGLNSKGNMIWDQSNPALGESLTAYDNFGSYLAAGNFDGDDFDDLVIGTHGKDVNNLSNAGKVQVLYGSSSGISAAGNQSWSQAGSVDGMLEANDLFGSALTTGDFDNDGYDDLAVGVYGEDVGTEVNAGAINVLYGASGGLNLSRNRCIHQNTPGVYGRSNAGDRFGRYLAAGKFNNDNYCDLIIGVPGEGYSGMTEAGLLNRLDGSSEGLRTDDSLYIKAENPGDNHNFGTKIASGDFNNDGNSDLLVSAPWRTFEGKESRGGVDLLLSNSDGSFTCLSWSF